MEFTWRNHTLFFQIKEIQQTTISQQDSTLINLQSANMDSAEKSSRKLEPEDKLSRVPGDLAFIIYRALPIGILSTMVYLSYQRWDVWHSHLFIILLNPSVMGFCIGFRKAGIFEFEYTAEEAQSREAWADMLRMRIEDYEKYSPKYPFGSIEPQTPERVKKDIQCQKERAATYLTGSRQGIPPSMSRREGRYLVNIYYVVSVTGLTLICGDIPYGPQSRLLCSSTAELTFFLIVLGCGLILWGLFSFQFGRWWEWNEKLGRAVGAIRKACESVDIEEGGDTRAELEWWIEAILTEESDSVALAKERRQVIIAPILRMIRL